MCVKEVYYILCAEEVVRQRIITTDGQHNTYACNAVDLSVTRNIPTRNMPTRNIPPWKYPHQKYPHRKYSPLEISPPEISPQAICIQENCPQGNCLKKKSETVTSKSYFLWGFFIEPYRLRVRMQYQTSTPAHWPFRKLYAFICLV